MLFLIEIFSIFVVAAIVSSSPLDSSQKKSCRTTEDELQAMRVALMGMYDGTYLSEASGCNQLLTEVVVGARMLKSFLVRRIEETDEEYDRTKQLLKQQEAALVAELDEILVIFEQPKVVTSLTAEIENLHRKINDLKKVKKKYVADLVHYDEILSPKRILMEVDDDFFFKTLNECTFSVGQVEQLITEFKEITDLLVGYATEPLQFNCFETLLVHFVNIAQMIAHRNKETRIDSLENTFAERIRSLQERIDGYKRRNDQQARKDVSEAGENYQSLLLKYGELNKEVGKLNKDTIEKGIQSVKKMILMQVEEAQEIYLKIKVDIPNTLQSILDETYDCKTDNLFSTIQFAKANAMNDGLKMIRDKMEKCAQLDSPLILAIANGLNDKTLDINVENVYDGWLSQLAKGDYEQIQHIEQLLGKQVMNYPKLFQRALEHNESGKNVAALQEFIESRNDNEQMLIDFCEEVQKRKCGGLPLSICLAPSKMAKNVKDARRCVKMAENGEYA